MGNCYFNQFTHPWYLVSTLAFKTCPDCGKEFKATPEFFFRQSGGRKTFRKRCKKCHQIYSVQKTKEKGYNQHTKEKTFKKVVKAYKTDRCILCKTELKPGKWIRHHVNYPKDKTVLICRGCHNWLHGRSCYRHPYKDKYPPDIAAYKFVASAYRLYFEHDPRMDEIITINKKTGKRIELDKSKSPTVGYGCIPPGTELRGK